MLCHEPRVSFEELVQTTTSHERWLQYPSLPVVSASERKVGIGQSTVVGTVNTVYGDKVTTGMHSTIHSNSEERNGAEDLVTLSIG